MIAGPLVNPERLAAALADDPPTLLDVRWALGDPDGEWRYRESHIGGAVFVDLDRELAAPPGPRGRHPLPSQEAFTGAMRAKGVSARRPVVALDAGPGHAAARAWWLLRYFGHPAVAVLDGGLAAWVAAGRPLTTDAPTPVRGDFTAVPGGMPVLDAGAAGELPAAGVLLDARAAERFAGTHEPIDPVAGHIPGATNLPTAELVAADGRLHEVTALRDVFASRGVDAATELGAYCGSGVSAAQTVLAAEIAGLRAALYAGSWSEWICDARRPIAGG